MAYRVNLTSLQTSTVEILNTIRANASLEYQQNVPEITKATEIPKVGDAIFGVAGLTNQFVSALMNRIAIVLVKSATFNNPYVELKKGYVEFGETIEEVFVNIAKVRDFDAEKGEKREFKRTLPDVKTAFHAINWRVQYPLTIQDQDLRTAFLTAEGLTDFIAKLVDSMYTAKSYDEYLLFKYLIIKSVTHGGMKPVAVPNAVGNELATKFRAISNKLGFMSTEYNPSGVFTTTPKADQRIFMDTDLDAGFDVEVLSSAFNMDKAEYLAKRYLIDSWDTFDNERWATIRSESDAVEEVTDDELALMRNVKAVLVDTDFFQVYDNLLKFTETYVGSGMYWNYFLNNYMTISPSPFANAIVFVSDDAALTPANELTFEISSIVDSENGTIVTFESHNAESLKSQNIRFIQTDGAVTGGIGVYSYGAVNYPKNANAIALQCKIGDTVYNSAVFDYTSANIGDTVKFTKQ